jgi:hypothetical protein
MNIITYLRQWRFEGYALFDLALSFLGMWLLSSLLTKIFRIIHVQVPVRNWIILTLPISIIAHLLVGQHTPMVRNFLNPNGHWILKIVILLCLIFGLWGVRIK